MRLVTTIAVALVLTGCQASTSKIPHVESSANEEVVTATVSHFEKNQECARELPRIVKMEKEYAEKSQNSWVANIQEIFYSPKTDSCLYVTHINSYTTVLTMKTLMSTSQQIGSEPIEDRACEFVSDEIAWQQFSSEPSINKEVLGCQDFDRFVLSYK